MSRKTAIHQLIQQARADKATEPMVLDALMDMIVFIHAPKNQASDYVLPTQSRRQDGTVVIPFFSDQNQADAAADTDVDVISIVGRTLFETTRGAELLLNPGTEAYTFGPKEISSRLDGEGATIIQRVGPISSKSLVVAKIDADWLIEPLKELFTCLDVDAAYIAARVSVTDSEEYELWISVQAPALVSEHIHGATMSTIDSLGQSPQRSVDLFIFPPGSPPEWLEFLGVTPFYVRPQ